MEQRLKGSCVAVEDAPNTLRREECASSMGQRPNDAAVKDAQTFQSREECALSMEQKLNTNDAAMKDAPNTLRREACASSMGQSSNDAAVKDAPIMHGKEEYVGGTGQTVATLMKNPLLLHHAMDPNSKRLLLLILISVLQQVRATIVCLEW